MNARDNIIVINRVQPQQLSFIFNSSLFDFVLNQRNFVLFTIMGTVFSFLQRANVCEFSTVCSMLNSPSPLLPTGRCVYYSLPLQSWHYRGAYSVLFLVACRKQSNLSFCYYHTGSSLLTMSRYPRQAHCKDYSLVPLEHQD